MTQGGLCDLQLCGGLPEVQRFGDPNEVSKMPQLH
jgi:hypothetical protein